MQMLPSFKEDEISQIPALQLLQNLGYTYLTPQEALAARGGKTSNVILEDILETQLKKINKITFKGKQYDFSDSNIKAAGLALKDYMYDGLIRTNESIYDLLTLGKSFDEIIEGDKKSPQLRYIDWQNIENNVFHVTEEFEVYDGKLKPAEENETDINDGEAVENKKPRRPDIVLFVNGIPFVVIECKRPDIKRPIDQAISQQIRNQKDDYIPNLFVYSQLLLAIAATNTEPRYATTGTGAKFWSTWTEKSDYKEELSKLINTKLSEDKKNKLFADRFNYVRNYFEEMEKNERQITEQDVLLYSLCKPERLLELVYQFIVFDGGIKKITRYQQYFAIKNTLKKVLNINNEGKREGGVVWHTQGSGKSLTMVMMAKAIALEPSIKDPRIIVVTDRIDLDKQIHGTFKKCGKEAFRAKTGEELVKYIDDKKELITTLINKFDAVLRKPNIEINSKNTFILIDESHRSQYGSANVKMQKVFSDACYIGFTGTPLMKDDKNTAKKFGGIIDTYTIEEAVKDKAVVPLLYEGRYTVQDVTQSIDNWFELISKPLTDKQKQDLKRKFSTERILNSADQKILRVAYDVSEHYINNWKDTGFKGQLVAASKKDAIKYKKYFDEIGLISTEVLISPPDEREGYEDINEETDELVQAFWKKMMKIHLDDSKYNDNVIADFKSGNIDIIIVVSKLLTGFDEPTNTVLYVAKKLKEHTLLQAIARVNRLCEGKDFGYIIDYYGLLGELDKALTQYSNAGLSDFDEEDLKGTLTNVMEEIDKLAQRHSQLWDIFNELPNKMDEEAYERFLSTQELRDKFYERLSLFNRTLQIALSTLKFVNETPEDIINKYKADAKFFLKLRVAVKERYAETIEYKEYEPKIQKLIDTYITSDEIIQITEQVNIFDEEKFNAAVEKIDNKRIASKADTIAYNLLKSIDVKMNEDPVFYEKFSRMIKETIQKHKDKILSDIQYYDAIQEHLKSVREKKEDNLPSQLHFREAAQAFYRVTNELLGKFNSETFDARNISADIGVKIDDVIRINKIVDWTKNADIQRIMQNEIEDYLLEIRRTYDINLTFDDIDQILDKSMLIAKSKSEYQN